MNDDKIFKQLVIADLNQISIELWKINNPIDAADYYRDIADKNTDAILKFQELWDEQVLD